MSSASVIGWLLVGTGIAVLVATSWLLVIGRRSASWPSTPGTVVSAKGDTSSRSSRSGGTDYRVMVAYAYEVGGQRFEGHRIAFGDNLWGNARSRAEMDQRVSFYHPGREVKVYYDPASPDRCTLTPGVGNLPFNATLVIGAALVIVGASVMLGWIRVA
jgi:hypothetical protein